MENTLELRGLVMPSNYVSIDDEEMEYLDGSWGFWKTLAVITLGVAAVAACVAGGAFVVAAVASSAKVIAVCGTITKIGMGVAAGAGAVGAASAYYDTL